MSAVDGDTERHPTAAPVQPPRGWTLDQARRTGSGRVVLDVRAEEAFATGHIAASGNVPLEALAARRYELPMRDQPLLIVDAVPSRAAAAAVELAHAGYADVAHLLSPWSELANVVDTGPAARLWRPTPFLERALVGLPRGPALDVACGSGRNAVFLAMAGFEVDAWDHDPHALEAVERLAARHAVSVRTRDVDLEARDPGIPAERYAVVTCFRFLHRPLFRRLARAVAPGGHIIYETFRVGQERFGRPVRSDFLLRPGELRKAFRGFEVLVEEDTHPEGGPLTSRLLARKPR